MSHYLIEQIARTEKIEVRTSAEAIAAEGDGHLSALRIRDADGERDEPVDAAFVFIGAAPRTDWLEGVVARDERGFILAGADAKAAGWPLKRDPYLLETTVPGVFVAGDVRARSIKRVASAVGRGLDGRLTDPRVPGAGMTSSTSCAAIDLFDGLSDEELAAWAAVTRSATCRRARCCSSRASTRRGRCCCSTARSSTAPGQRSADAERTARPGSARSPRSPRARCRSRCAPTRRLPRRDRPARAVHRARARAAASCTSA